MYDSWSFSHKSRDLIQTLSLFKGIVSIDCGDLNTDFIYKDSTVLMILIQDYSDFYHIFMEYFLINFAKARHHFKTTL